MPLRGLGVSLWGEAARWRLKTPLEFRTRAIHNSRVAGNQKLKNLILG